MENKLLLKVKFLKKVQFETIYGALFFWVFGLFNHYANA
jgi:hypothetical protein